MKAPYIRCLTYLKVLKLPYLYEQNAQKPPFNTSTKET